MGEQSAARLAGDDYQHLYSWFELLQLLPLDSPYSHGFVEHPQAGSADDVTLHPRTKDGQPNIFRSNSTWTTGRPTRAKNWWKRRPPRHVRCSISYLTAGGS